MLDFGAFAGPKIVISAPILNYYNRNIPKSNKKKKRKKKKKSGIPLFYTAKVIQNFYISKGNVNNKIKLKQKGINY